MAEKNDSRMAGKITHVEMGSFLAEKSLMKEDYLYGSFCLIGREERLSTVGFQCRDEGCDSMGEKEEEEGCYLGFVFTARSWNLGLEY